MPEFSMKYLLILGLLAAFALNRSSSKAEAADYVVDPAQTILVVRLFKAGIGSALAHDHIIRAADPAGEAVINFENPSASSLWVEVRTDALKADELSMRKKYGLTKEMSEKDRREVQETMLSKKQMDAKAYPTIRFESTKIEMLSEGQFLITGSLTIHGVKNQVSFPAVVKKLNGTLSGQASFRFKQSDFKIQPYSAFFGTVRNQDESVMNVDLVLAPKTPE
ncbi:MAG: hypothetical protein C4520_17080 [Candidatus Abyssobacteria bacterium SURF_5]|uniref:Lipid/polyisoprenoid-binding YceI-like domain-containing protein n=1 Tax=Abyssobacteria bacterium (strain SURF_5) TaxID=2093360 RepID=A0A3A4NPB6_ABYX5|nr:MAG: hypothetical protein C4520_17080 [Candidatus Abyssubacteria bacterium SURF_5]